MVLGTLYTLDSFQTYANFHKIFETLLQNYIKKIKWRWIKIGGKMCELYIYKMRENSKLKGENQ